jgi:serine protease
MRALAASVVFICALVVAPASPAASTLFVPGRFPTIQAAIDASLDGDTILVSPGTYHERIDFGSKAVTVESTQGASVTVIDGGAAEAWS